MSSASATGGLGDQPGFRRFWVAATVSDVGTAVTTLALQVLVLVTLDGTATDVGLVSAARWAPYLVLGVLVGVWADRVRRRPVLVGTDLGRAVLLGLLPLLAGVDALTVPLLVAVIAAFGLLSLANDAVHQSFLPRIVPRSLLAPANARLAQSDAAAQTTGPVLAGALVSALGAPVAVLVDAVSFLVSGLLTATVRAPDPRPERDRTRGRGAALRRELRDGLAWVYRHRTLTPLAVGTHAWFLFFSVLSTAYVPFVLLGLGLDPFGLGVTLALTGVGGVVGATASTRVAARVGIARTVVGSRLTEATGFAVVAVAPAVGTADGEWATWLLLGTGQLVVGLGLGVEGPIEMAYRQAVTPDGLQGRVNTTMRSFNRAAIVVGAPLGGLLADRAGYRTALWVGVVGVALTAVLLGVSRFRHATPDDGADPGS